MILKKLGKRAESGAFCPNLGIKVPRSRLLRAKNESFQNDEINTPFDRSFNAEQKILIQYGVKTKNFKDMGLKRFTLSGGNVSLNL